MIFAECGCHGEVYDGELDADQDYCLYPEALQHIEALLMASSWAGNKVNLAAQAFLDKAKGD